MERLDKLLAATGQWSRKEAKALVKAGRVRVGRPAQGTSGGQGGPKAPRHSGWPAHCHGAGFM
ncbi:MAG: S4 domain-containing protein [Evtepia gabavorous]